ncbi:MAG: NUDIX domain-containing protein [Balneolales bacterium]|nr:NUDIX domain-containing protein [Balneolales bacterium]
MNHSSVVSELEVLLIKRNGFWDIPKGKREHGESLPMCAAREVAEETGIEIPSIVELLTSTQHAYEQNAESILKTTWWFVMITKSVDFKPQLEEGIEEISWVKLPKALELVEFDNLREVLHTFWLWFEESIPK